MWKTIWSALTGFSFLEYALGALIVALLAFSGVTYARLKAAQTEIARKDAIIALRDSTIRDLNVKIATKEAQIKGLRKEVGIKSVEIEATGAQLSDCAGMLRRTQRQLTSLRRTLSDAKAVTPEENWNVLEMDVSNALIRDIDGVLPGASAAAGN